MRAFNFCWYISKVGGGNLSKRKKPWTEKELAELKFLWRYHDAATIAEILGRTETAVTRHVSRLKLPKHRQKLPIDFASHWTEKEDNILTFYWGNMKVTRISKKLGRTTKSVCKRALMLKLGPTNRGKHSIRSMHLEFGYSRRQIARAISRAGIQIKRGLSRGGSGFGTWFLISEQQETKIHEEIAAEKERLSSIPPPHLQSSWGDGKPGATKPKKCLRCESDKDSYYAKGMCYKCYTKVKTSWGIAGVFPTDSGRYNHKTRKLPHRTVNVFEYSEGSNGCSFKLLTTGVDVDNVCQRCRKSDSVKRTDSVCLTCVRTYKLTPCVFLHCTKKTSIDSYMYTHITRKRRMLRGVNF